MHTEVTATREPGCLTHSTLRGSWVTGSGLSAVRPHMTNAHSIQLIRQNRGVKKYFIWDCLRPFPTPRDRLYLTPLLYSNLFAPYLALWPHRPPLSLSLLLLRMYDQNVALTFIRPLVSSRYERFFRGLIFFTYRVFFPFFQYRPNLRFNRKN